MNPETYTKTPIPSSVNLVTAADSPDRLRPLAAKLAAEFGPALQGVVNTVSPGAPPRGAAGASDDAASAAPRNAALPDSAPRSAARVEHLLHGSAVLQEQLCGLWFEISANAFFQVNRGAAEILYGVVAEAAALSPSDTVLDLFCGAGTIGLTLASRCGRVVGYELVPEAVANARRNALANGIHNATFVQGDLAKIR